MTDRIVGPEYDSTPSLGYPNGPKGLNRKCVKCGKPMRQMFDGGLPAHEECQMGPIGFSGGEVEITKPVDWRARRANEWDGMTRRQRLQERFSNE